MMEQEIKITGIALAHTRHSDRERPEILANFTFKYGSFEVSGCTLVARGGDRQVRVWWPRFYNPKIDVHSHMYVTDLDARLAAQRAAVAAYLQFGGDPKMVAGEVQQAAPGRCDHVTGKSIGPDPFDEVEESGAGAVFDALVDEADDHEAAEGLHRTLGVDAIAETMERAGL